MKHTPSLRPQIHGSALLVALVFGAILCTLLGSFLFLTQFESKSVARSQQWNTAMVAAEAGMEEGLSLINRYADGTGQLTTWPSIAQSVPNNWESPAANVYAMKRTLDSISKYAVYITNLNNAPVIKSVGYALIPNTTNYVARAIQITSKAQSYTLGGVLAKKGIKINDASTFDSYNSQDPNYSTNGMYDVTKRKDGANVGSVQSNVVAAINAMGFAKIYGKIATSPSAGVSISSGVKVGSLAWVDGGNTGVQPGWSRNDLNISVPDAPPVPSGTYVNLPAPGNVVLNAGGGTVRYVKKSSQYMMSGTNTLVITNGTVIIDAQSGIALNGSASIQIATNAQLLLYLGTENTQLNGVGVMNKTGNPTNFMVFGQNNCKQIEINGSTYFVGYVYAPYADITLNGNSDNAGAMVGMSFQIDGKMRFHYDESLALPQAGSSQYILASWREVTP